jgi:hypothetical protein
MSLVQYYNLLLFRISSSEYHIIGEDVDATDFTSNPAVSGLTTTEETAYDATLANIVTLKSTITTLSQLPPGTKLTSLETLDVSNCTAISQIPTSYSAGLLTLLVASTKVSSIPTTFSSLKTLEISNCKRIASVGISSLETLIMSHSAVTEITNLNALTRLVALTSKVTSIPAAPNLVVVTWSGVSSSTLSVDPNNTSIVQIITTGSTASITSDNGVITSIVS